MRNICLSINSIGFGRWKSKTKAVYQFMVELGLNRVIARINISEKYQSEIHTHIADLPNHHDSIHKKSSISMTFAARKKGLQLITGPTIGVMVPKRSGFCERKNSHTKRIMTNIIYHSIIYHFL